MRGFNNKTKNEETPDFERPMELKIKIAKQVQFQ